jgi:hypothetical protein
MSKAIVYGEGGIGIAVGSIQRLEKKVIECEVLEAFRGCEGLWVDELELIATSQHQWGSRFGANADPVEPLRGLLCSVGLNSNSKPLFVECDDCWLVELEQRLTPGADHVRFAVLISIAAPGCTNRLCQSFGGRESATTGSIGADEVSVTELADGLTALGLPATPEVTS